MENNNQTILDNLANNSIIFIFVVIPIGFALLCLPLTNLFDSYEIESDSDQTNQPNQPNIV